VLPVIELDELPPVAVADRAIDDLDDRRFHIPDMNCKHCESTINGLLESMGIDVLELSLETKQVIAEFRSTRNRERAFDAIRDSGYTVVTQTDR
jgi:copper chaperone CopZ